METQIDFLKRLLKKLSESGIKFMIVGSVAASYHGYPRTTMDIDTVRQWQDALKVAETRAGNLDLDYIEKWSRELEVHDLWQRIRIVIFPPEIEKSHPTSGKAGGLKYVNRSKRIIYSPPEGGSSSNKLS